MSKLKVGVVSGILNPRYGGPPAVIRGHIQGVGARADMRVFGVYDPGDEAELRALYPGSELFPAGFPRRWFRGEGLRQALAGAMGGLDVLHAHMLWDHAVWATGREAVRAGKPFIVSPHGNILNVRPWWPPHKVAYRELVLKRLLKRASFVHALSEAEAEGCRRFGVTCPVRVIPNGLPAADYLVQRDPGLALETWPVLKGRRVLLYMGRLAPLKGIDLLMAAFSRCQRRGAWILVIAGNDYRGYSRHVTDMIKIHRLEGSVVLPGPVRGALKQSLLGAVEAFVLPSRIEGFSVAMLEAMAASLPCVYTTQCFFRELAASGGGWEVPPQVGPIREALGECMKQGSKSLRAVGRAGNALGRDKYTLEIVADQVMDMYHAAVGRP